MIREDALDISVVIPCFTSSFWLAELVDRLVATLEQRGSTFEILLIDDASPDRTWNTITSIAEANSSVIGIQLMRNVGQFAALMCGLEHARGSIVVTMDDDLQHAPEDAPILLDALVDSDLDVVIARFDEKNQRWFRNLGSHLMDRIYRYAYDKPASLRMTSFRALRRPVVDAMMGFGTARPVPGALILKTTSRIENVDVSHHARPQGTSGYRLSRLIRSTLDNIVNSSTAPLYLLAMLGMLLTAVSAVMIFYYLWLAVVRSEPAPGFTTLVLLSVFFGGATLLAIGILGQYIGRVVTETTGAPRYIVRDQTIQDGEPS